MDISPVIKAVRVVFCLPETDSRSITMDCEKMDSPNVIDNGSVCITLANNLGAKTQELWSVEGKSRAISGFEAEMVIFYLHLLIVLIILFDSSNE